MEITSSTGTFDSYSNESNPYRYCWHGQNLYMWPPPSYDEDVALRLTFAAIEKIPSTATTAMNLPILGEDAVVAYCIAMWHGKDNNTRDKSYYMQQFEAKKRELIGWLDSARSDYPEGMLPSEWRDIARG